MANNANTTSGGADSEDEEDPRTPTSVSSQGSQGYDSAGSDFVDIEGFASIPDSSLPELQLQVIKKTTLSSHYKPTMYQDAFMPSLLIMNYLSGIGWHL